MIPLEEQLRLIRKSQRRERKRSIANSALKSKQREMLVPPKDACKKLVEACGGKLPEEPVFWWFGIPRDHSNPDAEIKWGITQPTPNEMPRVRQVWLEEHRAVPAPTAAELMRWWDVFSISWGDGRPFAVAHLDNYREESTDPGDTLAATLCNLVTEGLEKGWLKKP